MPFMAFLLPDARILAAATTSIINAMRPMIPVFNCSSFKSPSFFNAPERMLIASARPIIVPAAFKLPLLLVLSRTAMDPIRSINKALIAASAPISFSLSIPAISVSDTASIPMELAIFKSVPAWMSFCHDSRHPLTPSRIPTMESFMPEILPRPSLALLMNFLIPIRIPPKDSPFKVSIALLKSASARALIKVEITVPIPEPIPWAIFVSAVQIEPSVSKICDLERALVTVFQRSNATSFTFTAISLIRSRIE